MAKYSTFIAKSFYSSKLPFIGCMPESKIVIDANIC